MPTQFSPKALFQQDATLKDELQKNREARWLTVGFSYSLSEMANQGATKEQLDGAKMLISTLQNLWEPQVAPKQLPPKRLSFDNPGADQKPTDNK